MAVKNPYNTYQNNTVNTASPGELTLMLYNGCLKFMQLAKKGIEEKNIEQKNLNIQKAQNIVSELMVTLNMDVEVSKNIMRLYEFIHRRLVEANIKNDLNALTEAEALIVDFRDTWKQVIQVDRQQKFGRDGQV